MAKRRNAQYLQRGYPLPTVIDPEDCICVCVPIPNDPAHIRAFLGQLDYLGYWWTWERDPLKKGTEAAAVWRGVVDCVRWRLDNDCGCGGVSEQPLPLQFRYDENGNLEVSKDGGETWQDGSDYDERELITLLPGLPDYIDDKPCVGAAAIANKTKELVDVISAQIGSGADAATIAAAIIPLLVPLGLVAAPLAVFLTLIWGLITAMLALIDNGLEASFDTAFWNDYTCYWFCELDENVEVTQANIDSVYSQVSDRFGSGNPIATAVIGDILTALGTKMLTNAARSGVSTVFDCSGCQCGDLDCGFTTNLTTNLERWSVSVDKFDVATFEKPIGTLIGDGVAFAAGGAFTLAAYTEFEEPCYITSVTLFTLGRGSASTVGVAYKTTSGGSWVIAGVESYASWSAGVPKTIDINAPVVAIQIQSEAAAGQNNFNTVTINDPTP